MEGAAMSPSENPRTTGRRCSRLRRGRRTAEKATVEEATAPMTTAEEAGWEKQRADAEYTRLERIQSSANVWLGMLGTLFTLTGAVVLITGGAPRSSSRTTTSPCSGS
jgi:hypothetical protein